MAALRQLPQRLARTSTLAATLALVGCATAPVDLKQLARDAVCAAGDRFGRLDILPTPNGGIGLRLVTPDREAALEGLIAAWENNGQPTGVRTVVVDSPRPMLAVVIDDVGLHPNQLLPFWVLGQPITWALLPDAPHSEPYSQWLSNHGSSMIVHIPMEPEEARYMTLPGYITSAQPPEERARLFDHALAAVPDAIGFNNHMGSVLTADRAIMAELVARLPPGTLVLDSRTPTVSALAPAARKRGLPTAERSVFIDNERDAAAIRRQLEVALAIARTKGAATAIGHPYPETAQALAGFLADHREEVHLVPVERVASPPTLPRWLRECADGRSTWVPPTEDTAPGQARPGAAGPAATGGQAGGE